MLQKVLEEMKNTWGKDEEILLIMQKSGVYFILVDETKKGFVYPFPVYTYKGSSLLYCSSYIEREDAIKDILGRVRKL